MHALMQSLKKETKQDLFWAARCTIMLHWNQKKNNNNNNNKKRSAFYKQQFWHLAWEFIVCSRTFEKQNHWGHKSTSPEQKPVLQGLKKKTAWQKLSITLY